MSEKERKILKVLSIIILVSMLICLFFAYHNSRHSSAWHYGFYALGLAAFFLQYRHARNLPQPDTLTRLFPKSTEPSPEKDHKQ